MQPPSAAPARLSNRPRKPSGSRPTSNRESPRGSLDATLATPRSRSDSGAARAPEAAPLSQPLAQSQQLSLPPPPSDQSTVPHPPSQQPPPPSQPSLPCLTAQPSEAPVCTPPEIPRLSALGTMPLYDNHPQSMPLPSPPPASVRTLEGSAPRAACTPTQAESVSRAEAPSASASCGATSRSAWVLSPQVRKASSVRRSVLEYSRACSQSGEPRPVDVRPSDAGGNGESAALLPDGQERSDSRRHHTRPAQMMQSTNSDTGQRARAAHVWQLTSPLTSTLLTRAQRPRHRLGSKLGY